MATNNTIELEKYKDILLATIDYETHINLWKLDALQLVKEKEMNILIKQWIVTDCENGELTKLKKRLKQYTCLHKMMGNLEYSPYIQTATGYSINLFGNIAERVQKIVDRQLIKNRKECKDVMTMIALCRQTSFYNCNVTYLKNMMIDYHRLYSKKLQQREHYIFYFSEMSSPDFLHYIEVYEANNTATQIQITLRLGGKSICFFFAEGINLGLKVHWKNNTHIIIEHSNALMAIAKPKQIETYVGCFLQIEYVLVNC